MLIRNLGFKGVRVQRSGFGVYSRVYGLGSGVQTFESLMLGVDFQHLLLVIKTFFQS